MTRDRASNDSHQDNWASAAAPGDRPGRRALELWLESAGLGAYLATFLDNDVDVDVIRELTDEDLRELKIPVGARRRLLKARESLPDLERELDAQPSGAFPGGPERRQLTVMFCDLVGSTAFSTRLDPEDLADFIRDFQRVCSEQVARFEGYIARYMGDGVLIYFGYPQARENDAERAVHAALAIIEAVRQLETPTDVTPECRIGIATGPVMVGELVGEGEAQERTVVGETPNLANRLQGLAQPNELVIGRLTHRLTGERFDTRALPTRPVKGIETPVQAWVVSRASHRPARLGGADRTALIGRDEELALLMRRWEQAGQGAGQVVLLSAEPGVGKSRLVRELIAAAEATAPWVAQCSPLHRNDAFYPIREQLIASLGPSLSLTSGADRAVVLDRLETHACALGLDDGCIAGLALLLGIPTEGRFPALLLEPAAIQGRIFAVLGEYLEGLALQEPRLLVIEDLHWADSATLELVSQWIALIRGLPILLCVTYRPELGERWPGGGALTRLSLNQLTEHDSERLVQELAGERELTPELIAQVVTRTDGVPLFLEELAQSLMESDQHEGIPETLRDSLTARLDRLRFGKAVAQHAAVIGRGFAGELLELTWEAPSSELQRGIEELIGAGLVHRRAGERASYEFKHALVRDAAYDSILLRTRRLWHRRVATVLGEQAPSETLAHHWTAAAEWERALDAWRRAIDGARLSGALDDAQKLLDRVRSVFSEVPAAAETDQLRADIEHEHSVLLQTTLGWGRPEMIEPAGRALAIARKHADVYRQIRALHLYVVHHAVRGEPESSLGYAREAMAAATASGQASDIHLACKALAVSHQHADKPTEARAYAKRCLAREPDDSNMQKYAAWSGASLGFLDEALELAEGRIVLAEASHRPRAICDALWVLGDVSSHRGEYERVLQISEQMIALCEEHDIGPYLLGAAHELRARALPELGRAGEAIALARQSIDTAHSTGSLQIALRRLMGLAHVLSVAGRYVEAEQAAAECLAMVTPGSKRWGHASFCAGQVLQTIGATVSDRLDEDAETYLRRALSVSRLNPPDSMTLRVAVTLARWLRDQQRSAEARELLEPIYEQFPEGFDTPRLRAAKSLLDDLRL